MDGKKSRPLVSTAGGLEVIGITKSFGEHKVLDETTFEVARGEIVALFGPDGAGKSLCFCVIAGLVKPDSGRIMLDDEDVTRLPTYRRAMLGLGYLPQEPSIFRGLTVKENIEAAIQTCEPDPAAATQRLEGLLADFRLDHLRDRAASRLSGGERRRCEIARALATQPGILLLDEPFAGLDPMSIEDIKKAILDLRKRKIGVLMTDCNIRDTIQVIDRACVLYEGRILFAGTPQAMLDDEEVRRRYLGRDFSW